MRANIEEEAVRTASAAGRVVEDPSSARAAPAAARVGIDDNLMVWVSRLIDQDVNLFTGGRLHGDQRTQPVRVRASFRRAHRRKSITRFN